MRMNSDDWSVLVLSVLSGVFFAVLMIITLVSIYSGRL